MNNKKLLVLDDDPLFGQSIISITKFSPFKVELCSDPEHFFAMVAGWEPDLIALDLIMPKMDGVEVLEQLAKLGCQAGIIITSGVGSRVLDAARRSAQDKGLTIIGTLGKPFSAKMFLSLLSTVAKVAVQTNSHIAHSDTLSTFDLASLQQVLDKQLLRVAYQPKINCQSGLIAGFEALARLHLPEQGNIPPDVFIPLAEQHGLIDTLTEQVFAMTLDWLTSLPEQIQQRNTLPGAITKLNELTVSVNISARSLNNRVLFDKLVKDCLQSGIATSRIIFELTESSAMEEPSFSLDTLTRLRMQGFQLSIDDFGTGFSSMVQLVRLPFSEIKIDKSFVMTVAVSEESRAVTRSIAELGQSLKLQVTAEGVEDQQTMDFLNQIGCHLAQGFFISRAIESPEVAEWFVRHLKHWDERRIDKLKNLGLLDTPEEEQFERHTRLAKRLFNVPIVLVSLVDENRQWFKSHQGLDVRQTPRTASFCSHTILSNQALVIEDAHQDDRFSTNELVTAAPHIRFYAGSPLRAADGSHIGTLCLIDVLPREFNAQQLRLLQDLALLVEQEIHANVRITKDYLTGFANRSGFELQAQKSLDLCRQLRLPVSLMLLDVDDFSLLNQQFGHAEGDKALQSCAALLRHVVRESDLLTRFGPDVFGIMLIDADEMQLKEVCLRLKAQLAEVNQHHNAAYELNFSIGSASTDHSQEADFAVLLEMAGNALAQVKAQKKRPSVSMVQS